MTYRETSPFAKGIAQLLERRDPKLVTSEMSKTLRKGRVFVDWSQNSRHKTTVSVYSLRALAQPTVSTPLTWDEVEAVTDSRDPDDLVFTAPQVIERVAEHGDLFAPVGRAEADVARRAITPPWTSKSAPSKTRSSARVRSAEPG